MPKSVVNPFLEMADFVASTIGKNVKYQRKFDPSECTVRRSSAKWVHPSLPTLR
jgi:hypothetical protein